MTALPSSCVAPLPSAQTVRLGGVLIASVFVLLALSLPVWEQDAAYHAFADTRNWLGIPHAGDVLSNALFALAALWGAWQWRAAWPQPGPLTPKLLHSMLLLGLLATACGSSYYHWAPTDMRLWWDRLGMLWIFAALVALAVDSLGERVTTWASAAGVLCAGVISLWVWEHSGNLLPWAVLQGLGLLVLLAIALRRPTASPYPWLQVVLWYMAAKLCEFADASIFSITAQWLSGHNLKHILAAWAVLPVVAIVPSHAQSAHRA